MIVGQCSTCERCSQQFELKPSQRVAANCVPKLCPFCAKGGKLCRRCGASFIRPIGATGRPTQFCSIDCRELHKRDYAERVSAELNPKIVLQKECGACGAEFRTTKKKTSLCSQCRAERLATGKVKRTCESCGEEFRASKAKMCKPCRQHADRQRAHKAASLRYQSQKGGMLSISPSASVGAIAERMFEMACLRNGWVTLTPCSEGNPGFDRVIYRDGEFIRVQVKGMRGSRFQPGEPWQLGGGFARLNLDGFDQLAVVDVETAFIWLLPSMRLWIIVAPQ